MVVNSSATTMESERRRKGQVYKDRSTGPNRPKSRRSSRANFRRKCHRLSPEKKRRTCSRSSGRFLP